MYRKISEHQAVRCLRPVWILAHDSMEFLAKEIVRHCNKCQQSPDSTCDGFPNLFIDNVKEMRGKDIIFIANFADPAVLFAEISMLFELPRYLAHSLTVVLSYFPTGTMERVDYEGQVATAKTLAIILSQIPPCARGPTQLMIFDIHALQERFYFGTGVIPRLESAIPLIISEIESQFQQDSIVIAFPDEGAHKRFSHFFAPDVVRIVCAKTRLGADNRIIKIREGKDDTRDKNVIIVDDLVQTGGTLIECAKVLKEHGALTINAFVVHAVFPVDSWRKFIHDPNSTEEKLFNNFWITDSIPHSIEIAKHKPFKLLSLAPLIAQCLLGFDLRQWD